MQNTNWAQVATITTAALFGVRADDLNIMHITIIFASMVGAMWSVNRHPQKNIYAATFLFLRIALTAAVLSTALSRLVAGFLPDHVSADGLMPIVAFFIGLIGDDWPKVYNYIISIFKQKAKEKSETQEKE